MRSQVSTTYKNSDRTLNNVNYKLCVLDMRVDSRSVDTKMVGERFFLTTFFVLLKVSDGWTLPDYLPTVGNINGNHERNYLIEQYFHLGLNYSEIISFLL